MNIFNQSNFLSQLITYTFLILISWRIVYLAQLYIPRQYQSGLTIVILYVLFYLLTCYVYECLFSIIGKLSCETKYHKLVCLLLIIVLPINIEFSFKALKILYYIHSNCNNKIIKYFDDKNVSIQYYALLMYAALIDVSIVLNWFEKTYIRKGLPIDSDFFPLYEALMSDECQQTK